MKKIILLVLVISLKTFAQSIELKPGSNGFVMIPNVGSLGTCTVSDKGKIVFYGVDNSLRICNGSEWTTISNSNNFTLPYFGNGNDPNGLGLLTINENYSSTSGVGISATSINGTGIRGNTSSYKGIWGSSVSGVAGYFNSTRGYSLQTNGKLQFSGNGVGTIASGKFLKSINSSGDTEWGDILPLDYTKNEALKILAVTNTNTGPSSAIVGTTSSLSGGKGVYGYAQEYNPTAATYGIFGFNQASNSIGSGVYGNHYGTGNGVLGESDGVGVKGISAVGKGVWGDGPVDGVRGSTTTGTGITGTASGANGIGAFFNSFNGPALITGFGNVGIGSVSPKYKMTFHSEVGDKISFWGGETNNTTNHYGMGVQAYALQIYVPESSDNIVFGTGRSAAFTENMRINGGGNVGIGTPSPDYKLQVNTVGNGAGIVHTNNAGIRVGTYTGFGAGWYGTLSNHPLFFFVNNGSAAMAITNTQNVGINTSTANSRLQVAGSIGLPYKEITSNYTLTDADYSVRVKGYQTINISLPSPVNRTGRIYVISADLPLLIQPNSGVSVFNPIYIFDHLGNNLLSNSNLSDASTGDFLYFFKALSGKITKKTSLTVQSTGSYWAIIDNDFQF